MDLGMTAPLRVKTENLKGRIQIGSIMNNPPSTIRVVRTSGRLESDWETQGEICWSDKKNCPQIRVFKNGGQNQTGHISKYIALKDFLDLNPEWSERASQVCQILGF